MTTESRRALIERESPGSFVWLPDHRVDRAKAAYTTRRIPKRIFKTLLPQGTPEAGDLVLARIDRTRQHGRIELTTGRRALLHPGDEVILCFGDRYAPDQFEAEVPDDLGPAHMVAAGGVAAAMLSRCRGIRPATEITPLGFLGDEFGSRLNLRDWGLPSSKGSVARPTTVAVAGTSMNAGKTSAAAALIKGLSRAGLRVGAAKVTGTGAGGDFWKMMDAGASPVFDFTDLGYASTYRVPLPEVESILARLVAHLAMARVEVAVLEVADGLLQQETAGLLAGSTFRENVDHVVFAAGDSMGAVAGLERLHSWGLTVPAISGALTRAPLAIRETADATGLPVLDLKQLSQPEIPVKLLGLESSRELRLV